MNESTSQVMIAPDTAVGAAADEAVGSRRDFLRASAAGLVLPLALTACDPKDDNSPITGKPASPAGSKPDVTGGTMAATADATSSKAGDMDAEHERRTKAFPAATEGKGNQLLQPSLENGVKTYRLTVSKLQWEIEPGKKVEAWAYNNQVPGPQLRVQQGERVRVLVTNNLDESTSIHWHGVEVPNDQDGVPFMTQPPIKPGQTYTYEFTPPNPGSHMYHSHHNAAKQVALGLLGAFIVEPKSPRAVEKVDVDYVMILNDGYHGYTLNGKGFPATEPIKAKLGQKVRIRYMNEGMMIHPMHLHGIHQLVIDKDGWPLPQPFRCDTLNIAPGERWDVIVNCNNPGVWAFHCHILPHAESEHGMFGMVTALIVEK